MSGTLLILVPLSFACIHFLEFTGIMARLGGIRSKSHMLGYSIQQAVYVGTRLFIVMLLPMLGLIVDTQIEKSSYRAMAVSALFGAAALSFMAYLLQNKVVSYYIGVIKSYKKTGNFVGSFFTFPATADQRPLSIGEQIKLAWASAEGKRIIFQSMVVFSIYGTGIFISFYAALSNYEYRASISQLSGIINSLGTVLLTFFIEPRISRGIDAERLDAESLVHALLIGRLLGVAILGQIILFTAFMVV